MDKTFTDGQSLFDGAQAEVLHEPCRRLGCCEEEVRRCEKRGNGEIEREREMKQTHEAVFVFSESIRSRLDVESSSRVFHQAHQLFCLEQKDEK